MGLDFWLAWFAETNQGDEVKAIAVAAEEQVVGESKWQYSTPHRRRNDSPPTAVETAQIRQAHIACRSAQSIQPPCRSDALTLPPALSPSV